MPALRRGYTGRDAGATPGLHRQGCRRYAGATPAGMPALRRGYTRTGATPRLADGERRAAPEGAALLASVPVAVLRHADCLPGPVGGEVLLAAVAVETS